MSMKKVSMLLIMVAMLFTNVSFVSAAVKTGWDLNAPRGISVDASGKIYVADVGNHRVQIYNSDESLYKTLGVKGVAGSDNSHFNVPKAVEVEKTTGDIYVLDCNNNRVQVFDAQGNWLRTISLPPNAFPSPVPEAMTLDGNGHLFVSDQNINIVYRFDTDGSNKIVVASSGLAGRPMGLAVDGSGNLYISQVLNHVVFEYQYNSSNDTYSKVKTIGVQNTPGSDNSHFNSPWGLYMDSSNRLYVADQTNKRVQVFNSDGSYALTISDIGFIIPHHAASDRNGNVYVSDRGANKIFLFKSQQSTGTALGQNIVPTFIGSVTTLTVDQNSGAADITSLLHVSDTDLGQIETWTASTSPSHGTLSITNATASSGGVDIAPGSTITYTPTAGYSGTDSFTVQVSDGVGGTATRAISVTRRGQVATPTANPVSGATVANNSSVTLRSATSGATIYYTTDGNTPATNSASGTNVTISGEPGATVTVKAIAAKAGSLNSNLATFTYTIQVPAPTNLTAAAGDGQATLSWTGVQGAITYSVYQRTAGGNYDSIPAAIVNGATYTVTGLTNGSMYYYAVKANYAGASSNYSNEAIATPRSSDANLNGLALSRGTLNPTFAPNIMSYEADVTNDVTSVTVTPNVSDADHATVTASVYTSSGNLKGGPFNLTSDTTSPSITLDEGSNVIKVVVTAQDNTTKTYTVTVTRVGSSNANLSGLSLSSGVLSPAFASGTTNYNATVLNDVSVTTVTYNTADSHAAADLRLNGVSVNNPVNLSVGSNIISVVVTAQDGTTKSYSVTVTRADSNNAVLSSLNLSGITLDQTVTGNVYAYTATVPYNVSVTTATYATTESHATVALNLNGAPVNNPISLHMGLNIISFVVTAQDGTVQTYTVNVTREPQLVANISVSSASETMYVGDSLQFSASVTPDNATDKTFSWSVVPGTGAATINEDGLLVATQVGMVTVQATAHDGSGIVGSKVITISNRSTSGGSHTDSPTDTQPTPAPVQIPESAQTPDSTPNPATDVFRSNVVQGDNNVVKNMETRIQEAKKDPAIANLSDTKGHWAEKTIDIFVKLHVIEGYDDGRFKPNGNITRAEFAMILNRVFDINGGDNTSTELKDVGSHWAKRAIEKFVKAGVINGYEDGTFKPDKTITREEMVVMLSRIVNLNNVAKDTFKGNFNDLEGSYATNEIKAEAQAGIINGKADGKFDPQNNATRAEALQIILNALKLNPQLKTLLDSFN